MRQGFRVIDTDTHVNPSMDVLLRYGDQALQECVDELKKTGAGSAYTRERLEQMLEFLASTSGLFEELVHMPTDALKGMARLRGKLKTLFGRATKARREP